MIFRKFIYKFFSAKALRMIFEAFPCSEVRQNADAEALSHSAHDIYFRTMWVKCKVIGLSVRFYMF